MTTTPSMMLREWQHDPCPVFGTQISNGTRVQYFSIRATSNVGEGNHQLNLKSRMQLKSRTALRKSKKLELGMVRGSKRTSTPRSTSKNVRLASCAQVRTVSMFSS